ncbi:MAG TPA: peptidase U34, partial [Bacteroidetes bacterium]|nr:peptidase U34 [Bacteroidota bacterium]
MCDTFGFFSKVDKNRSFFAKNSDRDPGEEQIIEIVSDAKENFKTDFLPVRLKKYLNVQFPKLKEVFPKYDYPYAAVISRPLWIWGAEMGVNEKGVAIGNEAVFSKQPLIKDGLLGMDILRLALHNAASSDEAAEFIIRLLETYGQGGNGSYSGTLKYHNSFLIKDPAKAIVIESSGKSWAKKDFNNYVSISNSYSFTDDYDDAGGDIKGKNLKRKFEKSYLEFFSKGDFRSNFTSTKIQNCDKDLNEMFEILRWHHGGSKKPKRGMGSICVHPGLIVKSETT